MVKRLTSQDILAGILLLLLMGSSALVLYGWLEQALWATTFWLGHASMKSNTALCFMSLGIGLAAVKLHWKILRQLASLLVLALSLATLVEYIGGWDLAIDQFLAFDIWQVNHPGRMAIGTCICMILAAVLLAIHHFAPHRHIALYDYILTGFLTLPLFGVFAFIFAPEEIQKTPILSDMGFHTCINFMLYFFALLFVTRSKGAAGLMTRQTRHAANFRILFFMVLILPLTLGSVLRYATEQQWIGSGIAIAIFSCFATLIISCALAHHTILSDLRLRQLLGEKQKSLLLQQQIHELIEIAADGVLLFDHQLQILHANSGAERILGYSPEELKSMFLEQLLPAHQSNTIYIDMDRYISNPNSPQSFSIPDRVLLKHKNGKELPVSVSLTKKHQGDQVLLIAIIKNMTRFDDQLRTLERKVFTDPLTQTLNRAAFQSFAERIGVHELRKSDVSFCVILMDIDDFKSINDSYGHDAGDQVLVEFAKQVKRVLRNGDRLFRTGGEEFIIITCNLTEKDAAQFAERIRKAVKSLRVPYGDESLCISCSIGVCVIDSHKGDIMNAVKRADGAMYQAKHNGKNRVVVAPTIQRMPTNQQLTVS